MTVFSKKYFKISTLLFSLFNGIIFAPHSYSMEHVEPWGDRQNSRANLVQTMREECLVPCGLFALLPAGAMHKVNYNDDLEQMRKKEKLNAPLSMFDSVSDQLLSEELEKFSSSEDTYLQNSMSLILKGEDTSEIYRRGPFLAAIAASPRAYWKDARIALSLLAPHGNFYKYSRGEDSEKRHVLFSVAEDIFCSLEDRDFAFCHIALENEDSFSHTERLRKDAAIRSFKEDESSPPNLLRKRIEKAKEDLNLGYTRHIEDDVSDKITMRLNTSKLFLVHILEDEEVNLQVRCEVAEFLSGLAYKGNVYEISGEKLWDLGRSFFIRLGHTSSYPLPERLDALSKIMNRSNYFSEKEKESAKADLLSIAQHKDNPSQMRLRALAIGSTKDYLEVSKKFIELGYPILEEIFLNSDETLEVRKRAAEFFTETGSLYGVTYNNRAPYTDYHRTKEREERDKEILLSMIQDPKAPIEFKKSLINHMPFWMRKTLLIEIEKTSL